jgi:hypothetical protein
MVVSPVTPIIAGAVAASRRRLVRAFREAGAHSAPSAIAFEPRHGPARRYFRALIQYGALVEAKPGTYYLDEAKLEEHSAARRSRAMKLLAGVAVVGAALFGYSQL